MGARRRPREGRGASGGRRDGGRGRGAAEGPGGGGGCDAQDGSCEGGRARAARASEVEVEDKTAVWIPHVSGRERARNRSQGIIVFLSFNLTAPLVFFYGNGIEVIENLKQWHRGDVLIFNDA